MVYRVLKGCSRILEAGEEGTRPGKHHQGPVARERPIAGRNWGGRVPAQRRREQPVNEVFAYMADFNNNPMWSPDIAEVSRTSSAPTIVRGTTWRQVVVAGSAGCRMTSPWTSTSRTACTASRADRLSPRLRGDLQVRFIGGGHESLRRRERTRQGVREALRRDDRADVPRGDHIERGEPAKGAGDEDLSYPSKTESEIPRR